MDLFFLIFAVPTLVGVVAAAVLTARDAGLSGGRAVRRIVVCVGGGLLVSFLLFAGFVALYFAGGGH